MNSVIHATGKKKNKNKTIIENDKMRTSYAIF